MTFLRRTEAEPDPVIHTAAVGEFASKYDGPVVWGGPINQVGSFSSRRSATAVNLARARRALPELVREDFGRHGRLYYDMASPERLAYEPLLSGPLSALNPTEVCD